MGVKAQYSLKVSSLSPYALVTSVKTPVPSLRNSRLPKALSYHHCVV